MYYGWSKDFLDAGKKRLAGDTARAATSDEGKDLRREASALKEVVADLTLENRLLKKKHDRGWGRGAMRYPASEKAEIIRLVEQSHLPVRRTLEKLGIPRATFYAGTIFTEPAGLRLWATVRPGRGASGTASPRRSGAKSSTWLWSSRSCRLASWRCDSPTRDSTLCRRLRSTACSRRMTSSPARPIS